MRVEMSPFPRTWTRREFVGASTMAGAWMVMPPAARRGEPDLHALAAQAVDAARTAGAVYADVRITTTRSEHWTGVSEAPKQAELHGIGVRVLADNHWGFLSSTVWTSDEAARLAAGAVAQAKAHAKAYASVGKAREVSLGTIPVAKGTWTTPIKYDPFDVPPSERADVFLDGLGVLGRYPDVKRVIAGYEVSRQRKIFASSEGSSWSQTTYRTRGGFGFEILGVSSRNLPESGAISHAMPTRALGWEHISESGLTDSVPALMERAHAARHRKIVDVGRYDIVVSAQVMAALAYPMLAQATELDRAFGYEANASGTSYLDDPLAMLGVQRVGSPLLTVTANRSVAGGLGTVAWDDEGVVPDTYALVRDGVLVDYQTTREQAAWLAPYYAKAGQPVQSRACASAESGLYITMQGSPNIQIMPGKEDISYADLVAGVKKGLALDYATPENIKMDHQGLNGTAYASEMREIVNGKAGDYVDIMSPSFRAPELWKNLVALGGPSSVSWHPVRYTKGQPPQNDMTSVGGVPGKFANIAVIDLRRGR